jgi:hypothetical protein
MVLIVAVANLSGNWMKREKSDSGHEVYVYGFHIQL